MNKNDLLKLIKEDNEATDPMQAEANKFAWAVAGIGALVVSLATYLLELFIYGKDNIAVFIVLITAYFLTLAVQAIKTKRIPFIILSTLSGLLLIVLTVLYTFLLCRGAL